VGRKSSSRSTELRCLLAARTEGKAFFIDLEVTDTLAGIETEPPSGPESSCCCFRLQRSANRRSRIHIQTFGSWWPAAVDALVSQLTSVLRTAKFQPVILVGAGNLGSALLRYDGFAKEGFEIIAAFDIRPEGAKGGNSRIPVLPMTDLQSFIGANGVKLAILTVPGMSAQAVANQPVEAGVHAILNFSPLILQVPPNVVLNNVNLAIELENLSYFIT